MNVDNQTILHIKAGHLAPADLLARLIAKKPNAWGFVVQDTADGELAIQREDASGLVLENLQELQTNAKDYNLSIYFANLKAGYNVEDIQPFVIDDADGKPFMALFIEGDITGYPEPKDRTEQFNLASNLIIPQVLEYCETYEGDLERIVGKLNGELFNKNFMNTVGHRAVLHIVPHSGDVIFLGKNELGGVYDWGQVSNRHGFGDVSQEPAAEKPKKFSFGGKKSGPTSSVKPPEQNAPGVHTVGNTTHVRVPQDVATKGEGPRTSVPDVGAPTLAAKPPSWVHSNKDLRTWYNIVGGSIPAGSVLKKRLPIVVKDEVAAKITNQKDFDKYVMSKRLTTTGGSEATVLNVTKAETETATPQPSSQPLAPPSEQPELPILNPQQTEKVLDFVAKYLDGNSKEMSDPRTMQSLEKDIPTLSQQLGLKPEELLNAPASFWFGLMHTEPRALVLATLEFRNLWRPHVKQVTVTKSDSGTVTKTEKTGTTTKQESVAPPAPAKPSSKFSFGKKAA